MVANMENQRLSEYNRDQLESFRALAEAVERLTAGEIRELRDSWVPYLGFRVELDAFFEASFLPTCRETCFNTKWSACCGFESIFTFFADLVITYVESEPRERAALFEVLSKPNTGRHCVYLGDKGCLWKVTPISCAMFYCDPAKTLAFEERPEAKPAWETLQASEKQFTYPTQRVLFDDLEVFFRLRGLDSPHMYFHRSPGLMRLKKRHGLIR
jgi:hypothetical protein